MTKWVGFFRFLNRFTARGFGAVAQKALKRSLKPMRLLFSLGLCLSLIISACSADHNTTKGRVVRIGYQKAGITFLVKFKGGLERRFAPLNASVKWSEFTSGPPQMEALGTNALDIVQTGDAPVVVAQAAGTDVVYIANTPPGPKSIAILVPKDSPIQKLVDLKGKKVSFAKGSSPQYLTILALASVGLKYEDIQPVYLQPPDARSAFEHGSIDAMAVPDPYFAAAQIGANARVLTDGEGLMQFREFYLASRSFANSNPDLVKQFIEEVQEVGTWARSNPKEVVKFLSPHINVDVATLELAESRKKRYGAQPIQAEVLAEQQKLADTFFQLKLIPKPVKAEDAALLK